MTSQPSRLPPALMVAAIILFFETVSGTRHHPSAGIAPGLRRGFPRNGVPAYIVTRLAGAAGTGR
jgi:glycerol uptake facilitator-like aquaporin